MTLELNKKQEEALKEISKVHECTISDALDLAIFEAFEYLSDKRLLEETLEYEKHNGMKYYTEEEADMLIDAQQKEQN